MASLAEIREGLRIRLDTISGIRASGYVQPKPEPPAANVELVVNQYGQDFDGEWNPKFKVWVFVNGANQVSAQQALDTYLAPTGAKSIAAAIYGDASLGGLVHSVTVTGITDTPRLVATAGSELLGAAVGVEIFSV